MLLIRKRLVAGDVGTDQVFTRQNWNLQHIRLFNGATPGALTWVLDGGGKAVFPVGTDGTRGYADYQVSYTIPGNVLAGNVFAFLGGLAAADLVLGDVAGAGPAISTFRALSYLRTDVGAVNAVISANYAVQNGQGGSHPKAVVGYISASAGRATFPQNQQQTFLHEALIAARIDALQPAPDLADALSLDLTVQSDGASTSLYVVYY